MPALSDEYDFVLGKVMSALATAVDEEAVVGLLGELERDHLCLPTPRPDLSRRAADKLLALRRATGRWPSIAGD
jgi:hypothetical protein